MGRANARLTSARPMLLVERVVGQRGRVAHVGRNSTARGRPATGGWRAGVSTARTGLADRPSGPRRSLRASRRRSSSGCSTAGRCRGAAHLFIATELGLAPATVGRPGCRGVVDGRIIALFTLPLLGRDSVLSPDARRLPHRVAAGVVQQGRGCMNR